MRVAFFNELDTYALEAGMDAAAIITGLGHDPRIGDWYNNPSLGYGGYCLPKDTRQLAHEFEDIPSALIRNLTASNNLRKEYLAEKIMKSCDGAVGFYRLLSKSNSDSFRSSAVIDVLKLIKAQNREVYVFEPLMKKDDALGVFLDDFCEFARRSDIIVANRLTAELEAYRHKVFSRDCFYRD
jgi:UDPglucose 6-dehydrogenase